MKKFLIKVNDKQYEVEVEEIAVGGASAPVQPAEPVRPAAPVAPAAPKAVEKKSVPASASTINAPMPGTILKVNVSTGDVVKKGQVLLILEAMKMENEIVAPADGRVEAVNVSKGSSVNVGDVMVALA